ncbi:P-loop containing nucleoside triphosphate hydrolase [Sesbania bispinosa]|nr:P-loop containing nucleoside triphosphate hydrolase [Sesbania bispinosa]
MEVVISIAGKVAEYTVAPIGRQAGYLIFYKGNFKDLADHVKKLDAAKERMKHSIEEEKRSGKRIETDVEEWLKKVDEVIEKANQLQEDPRRAKVGCSRWSFPNLILLHQLSREATKIAKELFEVQGQGKFDRVGYLPALDGAASSSGTTGAENLLETRETFKEEIVKALKTLKHATLGSMGLPVWVSQLWTIQGEIADLLGLRFDEESVTVGIPSGDEYTTGILHKQNVCKLLMTSRNREVLLDMDAQKDFIFRLEVLSGPETWSLFQNMAGDVVNDISFKDLATQVAQKCAGLPLRLVTVARALKNKDVHAWKDALTQLQRVDHAGMDAITYSALELSYNSLESDEMKSIFLLIAVLQEGCDVEYLLKIAMGLGGIFKRANTMEDTRNRLHSIIGSLKASCLLLEGNTSVWIQMHDIVREVAISIASRDQHVFVGKPKAELKEWPTKDFLKSSNRFLEIPDTFFEGMGSLKVLDLTCLNLSSLPTSFRYLTHLQTLCLYYCILENMDAIGALKNLEILTLWKSSMIKLPSEIGTLTNLRMLDLSNSGIEVIPPNIISSLTKLEELYMGNTSVKWEGENSAKQSENASLVELRHLSNLTALEFQIREAWILPRDMKLMFEKLQRFKIVIGDVWEWFEIEDQALKTLKLKLSTNIHLEHGIKALIKGVEDLYLDEVHGIQNVLYQLNGKDFHC